MALRRGLSTSAHQMQVASRMDAFMGKGNIFASATAMAMKHNSVNLGQGFPTFEAPKFLGECIAEAVGKNQIQYSRPAGHPEFVDTLAKIYSPLLNRELNAMTEITVCSGAQSGIFNVTASFANEGDHVLCIEPYFDAYKKAADMFNVDVTGVPLRYNEQEKQFKLNAQELDDAITDRTKILIVNTPHNPTGKVFELEELQAIAEVVKKHPQLIVLSDEVYEFMVFDGKKHHRFANIEGMWNRTISCHSSGKIFSATGLRIGHLIGPENLVAPLMEAQGVINFCAPTMLQVACSNAFQIAQRTGYFEQLAQTLNQKRDVLCESLRAAGMNPILPEGGYFVLADTSKLDVPANPNVARDVAVNEYLTTKCGITGIPTSHFYSPHNRHLSDNVIRLAYCKTDQELQAAAQNLQQL